MSDRDRARLYFYNDTTGVQLTLKVRGQDRIAAADGFLQKWRAPVSESGRPRRNIRLYVVTDELLEGLSKFMKQLDAKVPKD